MHHRIRLRHLRTFVEIARHGALKPAALTLNMTQPAVSKVLKDLEEIVGERLVDRSRAGAELTQAGAVLLQYAEQSLAALQYGLSSLSALRSGTAGTLRLGGLPSVAARLLPLAVERFHGTAPGALVTVHQGAHDALVNSLREGRLDLVVGRLGAPESMSGLSFTQIYAERVVIVTAPDHPLAGGRRLEETLSWPIIYPPQDAAIRPLVDRLFISHGLEAPADRLESVSESFGRALVLGPLKPVWLISEGVVAAELRAGTLRRLDVDTDATAGPVGIMARAEEDPSPLVRLFRTAIQEVLPEVLSL